MPIPDSVHLDEVRTALKPLYDLLGISDVNVYSDPGLTIGNDSITFVVPATIESVDTDRPRADARARRELPRHPHPQESQRDVADVAYVVNVKIDGVAL